MLVIGVGVAALVIVALAVYERFAGEHPFADTLYDLWLRRQDLVALDRAAAENPRRADVVVTLTTLPSRVGTALPTCLNFAVVLPENFQSVGNSWIAAASPTEIARSSFGWHMLVPAWLGIVTMVGEGNANDNLRQYALRPPFKYQLLPIDSF